MSHDAFVFDHDGLRGMVAIAFESFFGGGSVVCGFRFSRTSGSGFGRGGGGGGRSQVDDLCLRWTFSFVWRWCGGGKRTVDMGCWHHGGRNV